ncbi:MAG: immunoglobulin domain-containing protein [Phycisphaerae bacterium]
MAYDAARQQVVVFGGGPAGDGGTPLRDMGTALWDGTHWDVRLPIVFPPARAGHVMCYDSARQVVLLHGGVAGTTRHRDTWSWNGESWQLVAQSGPLLAPGASLAFDASRGVAVLCGTTPEYTQFQTWEWDGTTWTFRIGGGASIVSDTAMVYDSNRAVCVLRQYSNTFEWNGIAWTHRTSTGPPARTGTAMAFDAARGVTVLFGGYVNAERQDTWEWDGATWTQRANAGPNRRAYHAMAFDSARGATVMFGGYRDSGGTPATALASDLWEWSGTTWVARTFGIPQRSGAGHMVFDAARGLMVYVRPRTNAEDGADGPIQTWEWDGELWRRKFTAHAPRNTTNMRIVFDTVRQHTLLFQGDYSPAPSYGSDYTAVMTFDRARGVALWRSTYDWWEWDGSTWTFTPTSFVDADYACTAYDSSRQLSVLYGWAGNGANPGTTYEWNGIDWAFQTNLSPSAWKKCSLAYNSARQVSVLFGGWDLTPNYRYWNEVWEWDGIAWIPRMAGGPAPRAEAAMAYDSSRGKFVLFGGGAAYAFGDTWEWDGIAPASIRTPPQSQFVVIGEAAEFAAVAWGSDPMTFQWRRNGLPLTDGTTPSGSVSSGANSATLRITSVGPADVAAYDVVATNPCGDVTSATAHLTVTRAECAGDLDGNGVVELPDLAILLTQFGCNTAEAGCSADIDVDGSVGLSDLAVLLAAFGTPCQ